MALSITPLSLSSTSHTGATLGDYYDEVTFQDSVPVGAFLVIAFAFRQYGGGGGGGVLLDDAGGGNQYPYAGTNPNTFGQPWVVLAAGRVRFPITGGATKLLNLGYGLGPLVRAWRLEGADTWEQAAISRSFEDNPSSATTAATWNASSSFPSLVGEHVLIGMVAAGTNSGIGISQTGDFTDTDTAAVSVPAYNVIPAEDWSTLAGTELVNPGSATVYQFKGDFTPDANCWLAAQAAYRPVWYGAGRDISLARGPDGRLVGSVRGNPTGFARDMEGAGSPSGGPLTGAGRSTCLAYDTAARLFHLGVSQAAPSSDLTDGGSGGYTVTLSTSRDQARVGSWDAGQVLWSPSSPPSAGVGYQAAEMALDAKSGLLLVMLYDHLGRRWLSSVGKLNSSRTAWEFSTPTERVTGAASWGHLLNLGNGRFRFAYVAEGTLARYAEETLVFLRYQRLNDQDALKVVEVTGLESSGSGEWSTPETVYTAPAVSGSAPQTWTVLDGVNQLRDAARGVYLVAYHEREVVLHPTDWLITSFTTTDLWKAVPGTLGSDGETWSWGSPVTLTAGELARGGAFNRRRDGVWRWYQPSGNLRQCRSLASDGSGTWS